MQNKTAFSGWIETGKYLAVIVESSVAIQCLPGKFNLRVAFGLLGTGIVFDAISLFYRVLTLVTGRFSSGFPLIGLIFYFWFTLASHFSLVAPHETAPGRLLAYKMADFALLAGLHGLIHFRSQKRPSRVV